jgi:hypothetical protein
MTVAIDKYNSGKIYKILNRITDDIYIGSTYQTLSQRMTKHRSKVKDPNLYKNSFYKLASQLGIDNFYIELIENYPCSNKEELRAREGHWIRQLGTLNDKIAGRTPKQFYEENKEDILKHQQEQYELHKEEIQQKQRIYRDSHKEIIAEQKKEYYEANKDKINDYKKQWYEQNKETVLERVKKHVEEHREQKLQYYKQRYQNNKDVMKQQQKEYHDKNKETIAEKKKQYYEANKEKFKERNNEKISCPCGGCYTKANKNKHLATKQHQALEESLQQPI